MFIKHLHKTTLIDYPGQIASTLFVGGCNFRCCFCYNNDLVYNHENIPTISDTDILDFLKNRIGLIDGVVITGGEPTCQQGLMEFLKELRSFDLKIKIDTNGYNYEVLKEIIGNQLADYIAMDLKAPLENYKEVTGVDLDTNLVEKSINLLKNQDSIISEFRTTVWKGYFDKYDPKKLLAPIKGASLYYIHNFFSLVKELPSSYLPASKEEVAGVLSLANKDIKEVKLRGDW
ncbi:anaerobic ribonucleoside-triphosphate reductase activating protein [Candidatus Margulisiibacteriota bacterium]